jgi:calcium-dependent protein kinase
MKSVDTDNNGVIDYNEFLTATMDRDKLTSKKNLEYTFKNFDKDGSGKISLNEIKSIFNNPKIKDDKVFVNLMLEADDNNDGEISLEEFITIMQKFIQ